MVREVSIDSLQQQVRTFRGESQEVCVFLWGGGIPPHVWDLDWGPPWGLSGLLLSLVCPLGLLLLQRFRSCRTGRFALPMPDAASAGGWGGVLCVVLSFPPIPSPPLPRPVSAPPSSPSPSPGPSGLGLLQQIRGLATMWATPRHFKD